MPSRSSFPITSPTASTSARGAPVTARSTAAIRSPVASGSARRRSSGEIRTKRFQHTYCAARLQTLDHGAPLSTYTVAWELGHSSVRTTERIYSHLGTIRRRAEVVEYRVEQHEKTLTDRIKALRAAETEAKAA
jgi:integrase